MRIRRETKRRRPLRRDAALATIRLMLGKITIVTVVIAALEFLTRCAIEVASLSGGVRRAPFVGLNPRTLVLATLMSDGPCLKCARRPYRVG